MNSIDRISELPEAIIGQILSLGTTKTAVSTIVLSKRWKNLVWNSVSTLHFIDSSFLKVPQFKKFVNNVLKLRDKSITLRKFIFESNRLRYKSQSTANFVHKLLGYAVSDSLEHLHLSMPAAGFDLIPANLNLTSLTTLRLQIPDYFCSSSSIRLPFDSLPQLEKLHLHGFEFHDSKLLSNCEKLVELSIVITTMHKADDKLTISAPNLLRLSISYYSRENSMAITLQLPKLTVFKFDSVNASPVIRTEDFLHLRTAKVRFTSRMFVLKQELLVNMLQILCHARHLTLSLPTFEYLYWISGALEVPLSPFSNLKTLTITTIEGNMKTNDRIPPLKYISVDVVNQVLNTIFRSSDVQHYIDVSRQCKRPRDWI